MISEQEVEKVAFLARLSLTPQEKQAYAQQLSSVLNHFQQLSEVPTEGVEPMVTPTDMSAHWRQDETKNWMDATGIADKADKAEAAVHQAPDRSGNLFKVPPVVGS